MNEWNVKKGAADKHVCVGDLLKLEFVRTAEQTFSCFFFSNNSKCELILPGFQILLEHILFL